MFSAIDARDDAQIALGQALVELRDLGVVQADLAEMTGLSARDVGAAIRAAKDRTTPGDSTPETADEQASDTTSDHNGAESH